MEMNQIYQIANAATQAAIGGTAVLAEDLSNVVDIGTAVFNANSVDKFVKALVDHIGRVIFVNRPYSGDMVGLMRDGWEYGAALEKIASDMPDAVENESWELTDGTSYDPNVFRQPNVYAKFYNKRTTYEIDRSIADMQVKSGLSSAGQLSAFIGMLFNEVEKSATVKQSEIARRTICNFIAATLHDYNSGGTYTGAGNTRAVNLLSRYNTQHSTTLTVADALYNPDFIRYAVYIMGITKRRLNTMSKLFNIGGRERFTPDDLMHVILLADFAAASDVYLQSSTYHNEFVKLPNAETVAYWQGSGTDYGFASTSTINVKTAGGDDVTASGILGVMFDGDAAAIMNPQRRVTTDYNAKAEFTNYFYKFDTQYFNDYNENFVVFYVA